MIEVKFTPWRMAYIKSSDVSHEHDEGCVLCRLHHDDPSNDADNLVLHRATHCYIVMNRYPYNSGHLMVVPYAHTADLAGLDATCAEELFHLSRRCVAVLEQVYQAHGFNLGMNLGRTAGAGIDEHLHMHIVPRWNGDTNFMPLIGGTKLVPVTLEHTYQQLRPLFDAFAQAHASEA
jgi:ATP adenylyltransferase